MCGGSWKRCIGKASSMASHKRPAHHVLHHRAERIWRPWVYQRVEGLHPRVCRGVYHMVYEGVCLWLHLWVHQGL